MNRRDFIKSLGVLSLALLLKPDFEIDESEAVEAVTIEECNKPLYRNQGYAQIGDAIFDMVSMSTTMDIDQKWMEEAPGLCRILQG